jgi:SWI/SNF-related matrix-associated actin-dependent regulator 1 of chromatin subfamily A
MKFNIPFKLLLTGITTIFILGTPLQNDLVELLSLLIFIMPDVFQSNSQALQKLFSVGTNDDPLSFERVERAKKMMNPFILRRRKDEVLNDLPTKSHRIEKCELTVYQKQLYNVFTALLF